jgi:hypothetical protein
MFRISRFMDEILHPTPALGVRAAPPGPVVIWNLVRRCNLACMHCYSISADIDFPGELSTAEVLSVMQDLKAFGVPALILSGGEPLLRPDLFEIAAEAKRLGFYTARPWRRASATSASATSASASTACRRRMTASAGSRARSRNRSPPCACCATWG